MPELNKRIQAMCDEDFEASMQEMIDWANQESAEGNDFEAVKTRAMVASEVRSKREEFRRFFEIGWYACLTRTGGALSEKLAKESNA